MYEEKNRDVGISWAKVSSTRNGLCHGGGGEKLEKKVLNLNITVFSQRFKDGGERIIEVKKVWFNEGKNITIKKNGKTYEGVISHSCEHPGVNVSLIKHVDEKGDINYIPEAEYFKFEYDI